MAKKRKEVVELGFLPVEWFSDRESVKKFLRGDLGAGLFNGAKLAFACLRQQITYGPDDDVYGAEPDDVGSVAFFTLLDLQKLVTVALGDPDRALLLKDDSGDCFDSAAAVKYLHEMILCCPQQEVFGRLHAHYLRKLTTEPTELSAAAATSGGAS